METQMTLHRASRQNASTDPSSTSQGLSQIQASCRRLADAADAEIERALNGDLQAEEFLASAHQIRGGQ
jgi:hypothetical protein